MRYERVLVGKGKKAHLRYDDHYALCSLGPVDNSKPTSDYPICENCKKRYKMWEGKAYGEEEVV